MKINTLNKKLSKQFNNCVMATKIDDSIVLMGSLDNWEDIITACHMASTKNSRIHVVNDIIFKGVKIPKMKIPELEDNTLDGKECDVLVIGGGITGTAILRELSKWNIKALLVDKEVDFAGHASGRNDGEVHPGIDLKKGSLKQHYVLLGNKMYDKVCSDLGVPFERIGQYVGFTKNWLRPFVRFYIYLRKRDGVEGTVILNAKELQKREPFLNNEFKFAMFSPTAGCVSPYNLTIAYAENAVENGAEVSLETAVLAMEVVNGEIISVKTNRGTIYPKLVINAAGCFADDIALMARDQFYSIHPRKGTDIILDKKASFITKSIAGIKGAKTSKNTKGGGILHTVHSNILVGPNAIETYLKEDFSTDQDSLKEVLDKQKITSPYLNEKDIITYFSGVRAPTFEEDFIIEFGRKTGNIIHCAGMQSPGLTAAPAVALDIEKMCIKFFKEKGTEIKKNDNFNPIRKAPVNLKEVSAGERDRLIKTNPNYGIIVCRCEEISKGEIIDALSGPICVPTIDGVKRRVRPGMGRCQGSFCQPLVAKIIAEYTHKDITEIRKNQSDSVIVYSHTKGK